jgi:RecB family exonuclease
MAPPSVTGLTLLTGPANSGKLGRVLRWWEERQALKPLIVVPTGPDARELSVEMAQLRGALVGQSPAITFDGLVRELLGRSPRYAGGFERSLLVTHLLRERPPRAPGFSPQFPGTAGVVASLLEQLGDSGRPPEEIERVLERWASVDEGSAVLAADIRGLSSGYRALRDQLGLSDRGDSVREALQAAGGWERPLALYGFTSFTLAQRRLVTALAGAAEVILVFDYEKANERSLTSRAELDYWKSLAVRADALEAAAPAYTHPAIAHLEQHFMDDGAERYPGPAWTGREGVRFLLASGRRNEAELAAEQVGEMIRDGLRPGDIAVVVRSVKPWGRLLEDVFVSCGIPCQVEERLSLDETGLGHAFLAGLRGFAADDPPAVLNYLRSPYSALSLEDAGDVELDYLRGTARGVAALARCTDGVAPQALAGIRRSVEAGPGGATVNLDAARGLARHMLANSFRGGAAGPAAGSGSAAGSVSADGLAEGGGSSEGPSADQAADARAFRALQGALDALAAHRDAGRLPAGVLRSDVLLTALGRMAVPAGPSGSADAVQVLTAHRARARRFQAVLILGLVDGEFPGRGDRPTLLTKAQRAQLDRVGGGLFSPESDQEEALFVRAASRASKALLLSARDADDAGGYAAQSYYWWHCKALLGVGEKDHLRRTLADQVFDLANAPTLRQYLRSCAVCEEEPHPECGAVSRASTWHRSGGLAGLSSPQVLAELAAAAFFSPSVLESYLRCPFGWFVDRVVGAEDMETVADNRVLGDLLHAVMRDTLRALKDADRLPLRAENLADAVQTARAIVERLVQSEECPGTPAERRLMEWRLKRMAGDLLAMDAATAGPLVMADTELSVGGAAGVDVGGLRLRGRIDRVDGTARGELFVVDYKSGRAPKKGEIGTAEGLQLPLYMLALAAERPEATVVGGAYVSAKDKARAGVVAAGCEDLLGSDTRNCRVADDDGLREILDGALDLALQAAEGMRRGAIAPLPQRDCPAYCDLRPVCRAFRGARRW